MSTYHLRYSPHRTRGYRRCARLERVQEPMINDIEQFTFLLHGRPRDVLVAQGVEVIPNRDIRGAILLLNWQDPTAPSLQNDEEERLSEIALPTAALLSEASIVKLILVFQEQLRLIQTLPLPSEFL